MIKEESKKVLPNIAFIGKRAGYSPVESVSDGDVTIDLPTDQSRPFYHEEARRICRLLPWLYKKVISKS